MEKWPRDRLTLAFRFLASLPSQSNVTLKDAVRELRCTRSTFYRLVADLRHAGFGIERRRLSSGQTAYSLVKHDQELIDRILGVRRAA